MPKGNLLGDYLSEAEVAAELDHTTRTLRKWRRVGYGPAVTMIGRKPYYLKATISTWLRNRELKAADAAA